MYLYILSQVSLTNEEAMIKSQNVPFSKNTQNRGGC